MTKAQTKAMTKRFASLIHHRVTIWHTLALGPALLLAGAALASVRHQTPQNPPPATSPQRETRTTSPQQFGEIIGRVVTEEGQPIFNARVSAIAVGSTNPGGSYSAATDAEGGFRLTDLPPAAYNLSANAPGYVAPPLASLSERPVYRLGESARIALIKGGVITGKVIDAGDAPITGITLRAIRVRDGEGKLVAPTAASQQRPTDDRGIYRLFGLPPGTYIVMAAGLNRTGRPSEHEGEVPTFHPSATRDTAVEITIRSGEEVSGIDIRFRGERGRVISGTVTGGTGGTGANSGASIDLRHLATGTTINSTSAQLSDTRRGFAIYGVPDGDYEISAQRFSSGPSDPETFVALPRRVSVKGADVTGIELPLTALASITGRVQLEPASAESPAAACAGKRSPQPQETILATRRTDVAADENELLQRWISATSAPDAQSEFLFRSLTAARYRIEVRPPGESWYVKSITAPSPASARQTVDIGRGGLALRSGEKAKGLTVTLTEGAGSVRGRVTPESETAKLPARLRVHAIPVERERADDMLRYAQVNAASDGSFTLTNLAPGKYWLLARVISDDEITVITPRPAAWDNNERAKLRREAEAAKVEIELQPCQRVSDYALRYAPSTNK